MKKPVDTETFTFKNLNPKGRKSGDCVFRSLANAFQISWEEALKACTVMALKLGLAPNDPNCYTRLLKTLGIEKSPQPRWSSGTKFTGNEFCHHGSISADEVIIAHIGGHHITVIRNRKIEDIWNPGTRCIGNFWRIPTGDAFQNARTQLLTIANSIH